MFKLILFMLIPLTAKADDFLSWSQIKNNAASVGISTKAISHVQCFLENYEESTFNKKMVQNQPDVCGKNDHLEIGNSRTFTLIDYTKNSNHERMYLVDRKTGKFSLMAVAHGRYKAGFMNLFSSKNKNTILKAKYFSNDPGSNAPSSGFFITGKEYVGKFGRSLALHGLEKDINDNACLRSVVIHKHKMVSNKNAYVMSSGCPMVSGDMLGHVIEIMKESSSDRGGLVFIYGPREKAWASDTCPVELI